MDSLHGPCSVMATDVAYMQVLNFNLYAMQQYRRLGMDSLHGPSSELQPICCATQLDVVFIHIQVHILALS